MDCGDIPIFGPNNGGVYRPAEVTYLRYGLFHAGRRFPYVEKRRKEPLAEAMAVETFSFHGLLSFLFFCLRVWLELVIADFGRAAMSRKLSYGAPSADTTKERAEKE